MIIINLCNMLYTYNCKTYLNNILRKYYLDMHYILFTILDRILYNNMYICMLVILHIYIINTYINN